MPLIPWIWPAPWPPVDRPGAGGGAMGGPAEPTDDGVHGDADDPQATWNDEPLSDDAAPDEGDFGQLPTLRFP